MIPNDVILNKQGFRSILKDSSTISILKKWSIKILPKFICFSLQVNVTKLCIFVPSIPGGFEAPTGQITQK